MSAARPSAASFALIGSSVLLGVAGQAFLKTGAAAAQSGGVAETLASALATPAVLAGLALYALSSLLWLVVLSRVPLSLAYPFGSLAYVLVTLVALAMGETVPLLRWAGLVLIVTGVLLVGGLASPRRGRRSSAEGAS